MPESPEVQALVEFLDERANGRVIREVDVLEFRAIKTRARPPESVIGRAITGAVRHGKHVELSLDRGSLVISLGRHGWIRWREPGETDPPVDASPSIAPPALATFGFDDGASMEVTDAGGWVSIGLFAVDRASEVPAIAKLGPDPADPAFTRAQFDRALGVRRKQVKALLQEQESLAGIGNAYSDEILHLARIPPTAHAAALSDDERDRLFEATTTVVRDAIAARRGIPPSELKAAKVAAMRVHGRGGEECPVCGGTIEDYTVSSTTAQFCPTCQAP